MNLSPNLQFELAYDDKDRAGLDDEYYAKLMFVHPPKEGPTAGDGISSDMWRENKDMSGEMLTKVKRNNKILVEFHGNAIYQGLINEKILKNLIILIFIFVLFISKLHIEETMQQQEMLMYIKLQ